LKNICAGSVSQGADLESEYGGDGDAAASVTSFRISVFKVLFLAGRRLLKSGSMLLKKSISGSDCSYLLHACLAVKYSTQVLFNSSDDDCLSRFLPGRLALADAERTAAALCCVPLAL
jgi:hypothetical protein